MKIVHIVPGSGGKFYCQNCMRDSDLIRALRHPGHDSLMIPMYLPPNNWVNGLSPDTPIFYGAINIYLREKFPVFRHSPEWLIKLLDSKPFLGYAARKSGSTRPTGLEELTISMLKGEDGLQAGELDHLAKYLKEKIRPDIVHLSNALLLGLARRLKRDLGARIVCSLQNENEWIDLMDEEYRKKVWALMSEKASEVDMFIAPSRYYGGIAGRHLNLPTEKIEVVHGGIDLVGYERSELPFDPPVIGYLCRMSEYFGLGVIAEAFIRLKRDKRFENLKLHLTGGYTDDDRVFVKKMLKTISRNGFEKDVVVFEKFDKKSRIEFLKSLTLLSVPVLAGEAFGAYQVEALAAGVPIVQPEVGAFPEFIGKTGGGVVYNPNDSTTLAETIAGLLSEPDRIRQMGEMGRKAVHRNYSIQHVAENMISVYNRLMGAQT